MNTTRLTTGRLAMEADGVLVIALKTLAILDITLVIPPAVSCGAGVGSTAARRSFAPRLATATTLRTATSATVAASPDRSPEPTEPLIKCLSKA